MANVEHLGLNRSKKRPIKHGVTNKHFLQIGVFFRKFSAYTSLHGFVYISEEERCLAEKLFWICVVINVFVMCGLHSTSLIQFWNEGNILVTKESASIKVWDIPFPALTICSENQINSTEFNSTISQLQNGKNLTHLRDYVDMLCDASYSINKVKRRNNTKILEEDILQYAFKNLVLECERTILRVFWMNDELPSPCQFFQPTIMSTGVCYSLNMMSHKYLFNEQYYHMLENILSRHISSTKKLNRPWHVAGDMLSNSITMSINLRFKNFDQYCEITGNGVKIFVHNPLEHPLSSADYLYVTGDNSYLIQITPKSVTTSDSLVKWKPAHRGCFYQAEKVLRYFKIYTQSNCELECRINKTIERCGCVPFYLPRFQNTKICNLEKLKCVRDSASTRFAIFLLFMAHHSRVEYSIFGNKNSDVEDYDSYLKHCQCLPSCSELTYGTEISQTAANWTHIHKVNSNISRDFETLVVITLYFKQKSVDNWVRSPVLRFNELVANMGGIVSLYTGCSIVSLFEIMCFISLKKWLQNADTSNAASNEHQQLKSRKLLHRHSLKTIRNIHVKPTILSKTRF